MDALENLYAQYEATRPLAPLFAAAKYGFEWSLRDGCIFYPDNYLASSRCEILARIDPDIPSLVCPQSPDGSPLAGAAARLPRALLVLCGDREWTEREMTVIAPHIPEDLLARSITHRQLGDFLPYGDKRTRWFDVIRKSALPAAPKVRPKVARAFGLFRENLSRATFLAILRRYLLSADALIPCREMAEQYFSPLYRQLPDEVFADCGGFIGDTLEQYLKVKPGHEFAHYVIFEPDSENFSRLGQFVASLPPEVRARVHAHQLGVSREKESFRMVAGEGSNSYIGDDGDVEINCVAMDEFFPEQGPARPTFIKMDLQGHEAFALLGAREIIARHAPVLAISVYHFVQDLWELPLLIQSLNPDYTFFLRAYRPEEEYICYAVPAGRLMTTTF